MSKRLKRWGIIILGGLVALTTAVTVFLHWAGGNSNGSVHVGKPVLTTTPATTQPLNIQTTYFNTQLPAGFTIRRETTTPNNPIQLEMVVSNGHQEFAVTIGTLPPGGINSLGDYNLRVTKTSDFAPYRPAGMPIDSTAFSNITGDIGFADFWPHGDHYAEIALTSDGTAQLPDLFGTFEQATHNWQWL